MMLITSTGDVLPLPTTILWGGLNGNLSGDATKVQIGTTVYAYGTAFLAEKAYNDLLGAILKWDGAKPISLVASYQNPMTFSSVSPATDVQSGMQLTITGTNFDTSCKVYVGSLLAEIVSIPTTTQIIAAAPDLANATYDISILRGDGGTVYSSGAVVYAAGGGSTPTLSILSPGNISGTTGGTIAITGTNFTNVGGESVLISGLAVTPTYVSTTEVTITLATNWAPDHWGWGSYQGAYNLTYTNSNGTSNGLTLTVDA